MAQVNTNYAVNGASPSTVGGTGVGIKYFPNVPGPSIGVANTTPSSSSAKGQLNVPGNNTLNGQRFTINVTGNISIDPTISCPAVTIALYANTGTVLSPSYTAIATTGAVTAGNFDNEDFGLQAVLFGTTASGVVQGTQSAMFNASLANSTPKALQANLSGINFGAQIPFGLVVGVTFSVSGNNTANLYEFSLQS